MSPFLGPRYSGGLPFLFLPSELLEASAFISVFSWARRCDGKGPSHGM